MKRILFSITFILLTFSAFADEGMWMVHAINSALEKKMQDRGLQLSANEIYNADAPGTSVSDAVVSLGFFCTGSMISGQGLMITNHHCAYSNLFELSTPEHDLLEDGFWAMNQSDEIPVQSMPVLFLKRVLDVTDEVTALQKELVEAGKPFGGRKISYIMEKRYSENYPGMEVSLYSMWSDSKYYLAVYQQYTDVRLVGAPPVSVAAFGGDEDNWEWPQHKCDFALYRVYGDADGNPAPYSVSNVPLSNHKHIKVSTAGVQPGDFTMVIGYPGRTNRYSSSYFADYQTRIVLPVANEVHNGQIGTVRKWMDKEPELRQKYSNWFFGITNVGEMQEGEVMCVNRFGTIEDKKLREKELQEWIDADPERSRKYGNILVRLDSLYKATESVELDKAWFRNTLFSGTNVTKYYMRMHNSRNPRFAKKAFKMMFAETDPRVEKDLFRFAVNKYYSNVPDRYYGEYQRALKTEYGTDYNAIADAVWDSSVVAQPWRAKDFSADRDLDKEPLWKFISDVSIMDFNTANNNQKMRNEISSINHTYKQLLWEMGEDKGYLQYPDANSSMRISYGTVDGFEPRDGVEASWRSTFEGIRQKADANNHDFAYPESLIQKFPDGHDSEEHTGSPKRARKAENSGSEICIDFLTDNDITGGNSGSPVLNARGELVGLAFDGNKESLASDLEYTPYYNHCVCVDIRYVLWYLNNNGECESIVTEILH